MKQSTILYKVSTPGGVPLDRNDEPISQSGLPQAIALLVGEDNPDPALYEVVGYFNQEGTFQGVKTYRIDDDCDGGFLKISPARVDVSGGPAYLTLESGSAWFSPSPGLAEFAPEIGGPGRTMVEALAGGTVGQGYVYFTNENGGTARVYVVNLPGAPWILEDGTWNNDGKWEADGVWNY